MNPQIPLSALHPLRSPDAIGWWPPAPGWWVLLVAILVAVAVAAWVIRRRYRSNAYRRHALQQLARVQAAHRADADTSHYLAQINALLKSVALRAYPQRDIAAVHGGQWRAFLNRDLPETLQLQDTFDDAVYQKSCPDVDLPRIEQAAQYWIRKHRAAP